MDFSTPPLSPRHRPAGRRTSPQARGTYSPPERGDMVFTASRWCSGADVGHADRPPGRHHPTTSTTLYWLWLVHARKYLGSAAKDEFYLLWSTDTTTPPTPASTSPPDPPRRPWTNYGRVWNDTRSGCPPPRHERGLTRTPTSSSASTRSRAPGLVGTQTTCYATSPDCLTWTYGGIAVDTPLRNTYPGDGHTGYFRPFKIGGRWFAYHLMGGQNFSRTASASPRRTHWLKDPRPLLQAVDQLPTDLRWGWNGTNVVQWRGEWWGIGTIANLGSGGGSRIMRIVAARLTSDMRHFTGAPKVLLYPFQSPRPRTLSRSSPSSTTPAGSG